MSRLLRACLLAAIAVSPAGADDNGGAGEKMSVRVSPRVAHAPGRIVVRTSIQPHPDNRAIQIIAESTDYYRSSTMRLDGERAARTTVVQFRGLPLGDYRVSATLLGNREKVLATVHRDVIVSEPRQIITR